MYLINVILFASLLLQGAESKTRKNKVCAALGPSFPYPTNLNSYSSFQNATQQLDDAIDNALKTGTLPYGDGHYANTTFSLSFFNLNDDGLVWQRHYTDPSVANSPVGTHHVNADTIYQIGSVSKLITMYILLIVDGDKSYNDPISKYLPQLSKRANAYDPQYDALPDWDQITIADLGTHLGGIADDYGLDDIEFGPDGLSIPPGYPPLPSSRIPTCNTGQNRRYKTCTTKQLVDGLSTEPAIWTYGITPSYANAGYDLIGAAIESMTGKPLSVSFDEVFKQPLGLNHTFYYPPNDTSFAAIPVSENRSQYIVPLGATIPDGGYFVSSNDFMKIGKAMLNSTLLPVPLTRRWMKPRTFTSNPDAFVGAPWEIYQWETPTRIWNIYTKEGEVGTYSTIFGLVPDLNFGFTAFTTGARARSAAVENFGNLLAAIGLPAAQEVARQQADTNFGGRWATSQINTSVTITTDTQPGLKVTEWISNGTNLIEEGTDYRLWPNLLYAPDSGKVGFLMSMEPLMGGFMDVPLNEQCSTWLDLGGNQYGDVSAGSFVFDVDVSTGVATSVRLEAFTLTLTKEGGG